MPLLQSKPPRLPRKLEVRFPKLRGTDAEPDSAAGHRQSADRPGDREPAQVCRRRSGPVDGTGGWGLGVWTGRELSAVPDGGRPRFSLCFLL